MLEIGNDSKYFNRDVKQVIKHGTEEQIDIWFGPGRAIQGPKCFLMQPQYYYKALGYILEKHKDGEVSGEGDESELDLLKVDHARVR